jgi:hypothetical protein
VVTACLGTLAGLGPVMEIPEDALGLAFSVVGQTSDRYVGFLIVPQELARVGMVLPPGLLLETKRRATLPALAYEWKCVVRTEAAWIGNSSGLSDYGQRGFCSAGGSEPPRGRCATAPLGPSSRTTDRTAVESLSDTRGREDAQARLAAQAPETEGHCMEPTRGFEPRTC